MISIEGHLPFSIIFESFCLDAKHEQHDIIKAKHEHHDIIKRHKFSSNHVPQYFKRLESSLGSLGFVTRAQLLFRTNSIPILNVASMLFFFLPGFSRILLIDIVELLILFFLFLFTLSSHHPSPSTLFNIETRISRVNKVHACTFTHRHT